MAITTNMATSFKQELLQGGHCFNLTVTPTGTASSAATSVTSVSSMASVAVGCNVSGTSIAANTVVAAITSATALTLSIATTGAISGGTLTISADVFKMALIKPSMGGTYGTGSTNYTNITGNTDETSGTGYTATGTALVNVQPSSSAGVGFLSFSNPSWASATFSTAGCMIYNSSIRNGGTSGTNASGAGRACSVYDFGGVQQVNSGTFSVLMPTNDSANAVIRIA